MHADAQQKDVMQDVPYTAESAAVIAASLGGSTASASSASTSLAEFPRDGLARTQTAGAVWADLLAPSWNRDQERAADLASADMAKAAGYDVAAFGTLFSKLQAANAVRSARVEAVRQAALAKLQAVQPAAGGAAGQAMAGLEAGVGSYAVETAFASLSGLGADYDTPRQRADAVQAHLQQSAGARRDKTARSPRFRQVLRDGPAGAMLAADKAGLDVMAALAQGERMQAMMLAPGLLKAAGRGELPSPHLDLALGSWYDAAGQRDLAEERAAAWTATPLATRSGYLWRASYQAGRGEYDAAVATMELGAGRLGDRSLFLPQMVAMNRQKGDVKTAERLTLDCAKADTKPGLGTVTRLAQSGLAPTGGLYAECTAALGYDPIAKTQKQATDAAAELGKKGSGVKGLFDSLTKGGAKP
jgi:hypothetical protein